MKAVQKLPEDYRQVMQVNLQSDKKTALKVNLISLVLFVAMGVWMHLHIPIHTLRETMDEPGLFFLRLAVTLLGYAAYIILHELTHAAVMRAVGGGKVRFGFTGMYAYAGSEGDWFDRPAYLCVALAPLVCWGVVFAVLQALTPASWAWVVWFLQMGNVSGAAGDLYVSWRVLHMPADLLVRDTGLDMTGYSRSAG